MYVVSGVRVPLPFCEHTYQILEDAPVRKFLWWIWYLYVDEPYKLDFVQKSLKSTPKKFRLLADFFQSVLKA